MSHWSEDAIFYHIYPLGSSGAPPINDTRSEPAARLAGMTPWISYLQNLGVNALYIGPLFESATHGYDTTDYCTVDRRLGTNADLRDFVHICHDHGIRVVFDAVFNHVGRNHFAFRDLQVNGRDSRFKDIFYTDFTRQSPYEDGFWYEGWNRHYNLVKLNLKNAFTKRYLFDVIAFWMDAFAPDGLRLDAADCMDTDFFPELHAFCKSRRADFWLMGEVVHGNYRRWANATGLDSVTNYECYKGLWSSHNDGNYFEIEYSMNRQFGTNGIYKGLSLYTFADNHDVDRVASTLNDPAHLFPLYILLFTIPGVPSIYYGSEWGIPGKKAKGSDAAIRPAIDLSTFLRSPVNRDLQVVLRRLITLRKQLIALRRGSYQSLYIASKQYGFLRQHDKAASVVAVNSDKATAAISMPVPLSDKTVLTDVLNDNEQFEVQNGKLCLPLSPCWGRILIPQRNM